MKSNYPVMILLIIVSFVWAGSFIVVDVALKQGLVTALSLGFLRFLVASPLLILIVIIKRKPLKLPLKELPWLIILGLTGVTFLYLFQFIGIEYTNAPTASVLINTNVIFIAILSGLFLHESLTVKKIAGILLSFLGVLVIMFYDFSAQTLSFTNIFLLGCVLMLLSAFCWALYSLVGKKMLKTYDGLVITTYAFVLGTFFYLPFIAVDIGAIFLNTTLDVWLAVLYLAVVCSVFGYLGWYHALAHIDASKAAVFLNFIPLFTIIMSFLLGTLLTWFFFLGAAFILYGVFLTQRT